MCHQAREMWLIQTEISVSMEYTLDSKDAVPKKNVKYLTNIYFDYMLK